MNATVENCDSAYEKPAPAIRNLRRDQSSYSKSDRRRNRSFKWENASRRTVSLNSRPEKAIIDNGLRGKKEPLNILNNVIRVNDAEAAQKKLEIKYSARSDEYIRRTDSQLLKKNGWNSLVYAERNMELVTEHRQVAENDNVMVYLSRNPGSMSSYIRWKFDFSRSGLRVDRFALRFLYDTSEDGNVRAYLEEDFEDEEEPPSPLNRVPLFSSPTVRHIPEVQGWEKFSLVAELSCKRGSCVFHHSQLFLQQRNGGFFEKEVKKYPLKINISFA